MSRRARGALIPLLLAGCGPMYLYGQTGKVVGPPKPDDCHFELVEGRPSRPFDEVGVVAPDDIEFGSLADGPMEFSDQVRRYVCPAGGDAVVVEKNKWGRYERGTIVKYK